MESYSMSNYIEHNLESYSGVKSKKDKKSEQHVASQLDIRYTMPKGIINMLSATSNKTKPEVWCEISDMANICAFRLSTSRQRNSWTQKVFPGTTIKLRIDMQKETVHDDKLNFKNHYYKAKIKICGMSSETYTQAQINDYITEKILLGDDDDVKA